MSFPSTIKAVIKTGTDQVELATIPFGDQALEPNDVLIRTFAVGLNPVDERYSIGPLRDPDTRGSIIGSDAAGEVVAVGANVQHVHQGDRVFGLTYGGDTKVNGAFSEYVKYPESVVAKMPEGMTALQAAAFPIPHLTAALFLYHEKHLGLARPSAPTDKEKRILLIWGGATAVGHHAIQLASKSGYHVYATASPANHANLHSLGAEQCFNYRDADVVDQIKRTAEASGGVFAAIDCIGQGGTLESCIDAIASSGGAVVSTLPIPASASTRRANVQCQWSLVLTTLGYEIYVPGMGPFPASPTDAAFATNWLTKELPALLEGWHAAENGSERYKGQKLRVMQGGLGGIEEGLRVLQRGAFAAEKLVYSLE